MSDLTPTTYRCGCGSLTTSDWTATLADGVTRTLPGASRCHWCGEWIGHPDAIPKPAKPTLRLVKGDD